MFNLNQFTISITKTLLIFGILSYSNLLLAAGFYIQELGTPSSIGTAGSARTTNTHGAESAFGNPAGMTGLTEETFLVGSQLLVPNIRFDSDIAEAGGSDGGNSGEAAIIPSLYYVKPISDKVRYGFSIIAPLGGGTDYGDDFVGRYGATEVSLEGLAINNSFGYKVNDKFSVGAGVSILYTIFNMDLAVNQPGALPDGKVEIEDATDWGVQLFLGMTYQLNDKTLLGAVYRSKADINLRGDIDIKNTILPFSPAGRIGVSWDNPQLLEVGLQYEINDDLSLLVQADWEDWSKFSDNTFSISGSGGFSAVTTIDRDFRDTWRLGLGLAYHPNEHTYLFGVSYDSSPVSDSNRTIDLPLDEQIRFTTAYIRKSPDKRWDHALSASFLYLGDGKVDQVSQGVRYKGEFEENWGLFLGFTSRYRF